MDLCKKTALIMLQLHFVTSPTDISPTDISPTGTSGDVLPTGISPTMSVPHWTTQKDLIQPNKPKLTSWRNVVFGPVGKTSFVEMSVGETSVGEMTLCRHFSMFLHGGPFPSFSTSPTAHDRKCRRQEDPNSDRLKSR